MRVTIIGLAMVLTLCGTASVFGQDAGVEAGAEDDFTVRGTGGSRADPDLEARGYSAFGTTPANAQFVTSGAGQVFIERSLEVGSNLYVRGTGLVFPDQTMQTTAAVQGDQTLISGECDTNRVDVLLGTNYLFSSVLVWQSPVVAQAINVYSNGNLLQTFSLTGGTAGQALALRLGAFDRLGIACTNTAGTVLFSFQGRRP